MTNVQIDKMLNMLDRGQWMYLSAVQREWMERVYWAFPMRTWAAQYMRSSVDAYGVHPYA